MTQYVFKDSKVFGNSSEQWQSRRRLVLSNGGSLSAPLHSIRDSWHSVESAVPLFVTYKKQAQRYQPNVTIYSSCAPNLTIVGIAFTRSVSS